MARLDITGVDIHLGGRAILEGLDLTVQEGECLALLGPSGCGKTTTLRTVAGFLRPTRGEVSIGGVPVARVPPNKRNIGIVFQDYALFPHMTVAENVAYGLEARRVPPDQIAQRVGAALEQVRLADFGDRRPEQMSGGQRQRVALARAIVIRPDVLLLDEPLGALDRRLRDAMQVELKQLQRDVGITTIIVTHDQEEALSLSDRVAVMFDGKIEAIGPPAQVYDAPGSLRVMDFLGAMNLFEGTVAQGRLVAGPHRIDLPEGVRDGPARYGIRPEHIELLGMEAAGIPCTVEELVFKGPAVAVLARTEDDRLLHASLPASAVTDAGLKRGDPVRFGLPPRRLVGLTK